MEQSKDGSSITISMRISRDANRELRRMAGYPRGLGRTVSSLILAEAARREGRSETAKALAKKEAG